MDMWAFSQLTVSRRNPLPGEMSLAAWVTNRAWLKITNSVKQTMCSCTISGWNYFQLGPDPSTAALRHGLWAGWGQGRESLKDCRCHSCLESRGSGTLLRLALCIKQHEPVPASALSVLIMSQGCAQQPHKVIPAEWAQSLPPAASTQPASPHAHRLLAVAVSHVFGVSVAFSEPGHSVTIKVVSLCISAARFASWGEDLTDLLPGRCPPHLKCRWACQWKVTSAQGLSWSADFCLEGTRHDKKPGDCNLLDNIQISKNIPKDVNFLV